MEHRETKIEVRTTRDRLTGTLRLPRDGYRSRLTDYLNAADRSFLPLTDVEIVPLDGGGTAERHDVVVVSLSQIVLAMPLVGSSAEIGGGAL
jgi:hypothetical protein